MNATTYAGKISAGYDWQDIMLNGEPLSETISTDGWNGRKVFVRYFIADDAMASMEQAEERFVRQQYSGDCAAEYWPIMGSEWTGQYGTHEELRIGGHDLIEELRTHVGKYLMLEIRTEERP